MLPESLGPADSQEAIFSEEAVDNYLNNLRYDEDNNPLLLPQTFKRFKDPLVSSLIKFRSLNVYLASLIPQTFYRERKRDRESAKYFGYGFAMVLTIFFSNYDKINKRRIKVSSSRSRQDELLDTLRNLLAKDSPLDKLNTGSPAVERVAEFVGKKVLARTDLYPIFKTGVFIGYQALQTLVQP